MPMGKRLGPSPLGDRVPSPVRFPYTSDRLEDMPGWGEDVRGPRTLILDFTMTHPRIGRSHVHPSGQLTNIRRSMVLLNLMGL